MIAPERRWTLFVTALVGKVLLTLFLFHHHGGSWGGPWYLLGGDSASYIDPVESWIRGEGYTPDYRMPGFGIVLLLLRTFLPLEGALNALVVVQLLADAFTTVLIADIGWRITRSRWVHALVFWTTLASTYVTFYDRYILTETLTTFALIAGLHQLVVHAYDSAPRHLLVAGVLLAWGGFMRPAYLPLVPIACLVLFATPGARLGARLRNAVLLALPLAVADGLWIARNVAEHGEFRATTGTLLSPGMAQGIKLPVMRLMQAFGCDYVWWDGDAPIRWFNITDGPPPPPDDRPPSIPARVFTKDFDLDSLRLIRDDVARWNNATDSLEKGVLKARVTERCDRYIASLAHEKPFQYHVVARLALLRTFVIDSGTGALMARPMYLLTWWEKAFKVLQSVLYLGVMLLGLVGAVAALAAQRFANALRIVPIAFLYGVLAFPFLARMCENRYLVVVHPLAILFMVNLFHLASSLRSQRRGHQPA